MKEETPTQNRGEGKSPLRAICGSVHFFRVFLSVRTDLCLDVFLSISPFLKASYIDFQRMSSMGFCCINFSPSLGFID